MSIPYNGLIAETQVFPMIRDGESAKWITYEEFVCNLVKDRGSIQSNLDHMLLGCGGETGELIDAIKKYTCYGKVLDVTNVIEELGDLEFYMAGLRQMLQITREECIKANIAKLKVRYKDGSYSDQAAIAREDKNA